MTENVIGLLVNKKWKITEAIDTEGEVQVHRGESVSSPSETNVCIKVGSSGNEERFIKEYRFYRYLNSVEAPEGTLRIPQVYWTGSENGHYFMVMELCGPSLYFVRGDFNCYCNRTVLTVIGRSLKTLEWLYKHGVYHQSIVEPHILTSEQEHCTELYLVNFKNARIMTNVVTAAGRMTLPLESSPELEMLREYSLTLNLAQKTFCTVDIHNILLLVLQMLSLSISKDDPDWIEIFEPSKFQEDLEDEIREVITSFGEARKKLHTLHNDMGRHQQYNIDTLRCCVEYLEKRMNLPYSNKLDLDTRRTSP